MADADDAWQQLARRDAVVNDVLQNTVVPRWEAVVDRWLPPATRSGLWDPHKLLLCLRPRPGEDRFCLWNIADVMVASLLSADSVLRAAFALHWGGHDSDGAIPRVIRLDVEDAADRLGQPWESMAGIFFRGTLIEKPPERLPLELDEEPRGASGVRFAGSCQRTCFRGRWSVPRGKRKTCFLTPNACTRTHRPAHCR